MMDFETENFGNATVELEFCIRIRKDSYLVLYGKCARGYFCCIPDKNWGCEMSQPWEVEENILSLMGCGAKRSHAEGIANAIKIGCDEKKKRDK